MITAALIYIWYAYTLAIALLLGQKRNLELDD